MSGAPVWLLIIWAAIAGALIPVFAALNGSLGRALGSPFLAAQVSALAALAAVAATLAMVRPGWPSASAIASVPPAAWFGGVAMGFYAVSAAWLTPRLGVGNFVICVVLAQLSISAAIDQFGLFGAPAAPLDLKRIAGFTLLAAGAALAMMR